MFKQVHSFNLCRLKPPTFVISLANSIRIYSLDTVHNKFTPVTDFYKLKDPVTAIAWSPNLGRSFDTIAVGARDGYATILTFKQKDFHVLCQIYHPSTITKLEWNITGTVLSTVSNDSIKLWKADLSGKEFKCIKTIHQ